MKRTIFDIGDTIYCVAREDSESLKILKGKVSKILVFKDLDHEEKCWDEYKETYFYLKFENIFNSKLLDDEGDYLELYRHDDDRKELYSIPPEFEYVENYSINTGILNLAVTKKTIMDNRCFQHSLIESLTRAKQLINNDFDNENFWKTT